MKREAVKKQITAGCGAAFQSLLLATVTEALQAVKALPLPERSDRPREEILVRCIRNALGATAKDGFDKLVPLKTQEAIRSLDPSELLSDPTPTRMGLAHLALFDLGLCPVARALATNIDSGRVGQFSEADRSLAADLSIRAAGIIKRLASPKPFEFGPSSQVKEGKQTDGVGSASHPQETANFVQSRLRASFEAIAGRSGRDHK